jgi:hypothetical protein
MMADIRCPMCSRSNPEDAEECSFCGARLKPLIADEDALEQSASNQPQATGGGAAEEVPGWLSRIRERAEEEREPEQEPEQESDTDWLSRLRAVETDESGPPEELPDWLDQEGEEGQEDDWLGRLRESSDLGQEEEEPEPSAPDMAAGQQPEQPAAELEVDPEQQLRGMIVEEDSAEELESSVGSGLGEDDSFDWLEQGAEQVEAEEGAGEFPSFFEGEQQEEPKAPAPAKSEAEASDFESEEAEIPDWFGEFEQAAEEEEAEPEPVEDETPSGIFKGVSKQAVEEEELPSWLEGEAQEPGAPSQPQPEPEAAGGAGPPADEADVDWQEFDWDSLGDEQEPESLPQGLGAPPEEQEEGLPHVPALIIGEEGEGARPPGGEEFDLDAIELPDWLSEVDREPGAEVEAEGSGELAPATIPNWLEAMRPVETFKPVVDIEPEEERVVESVGPLAGLRGVLLAEPVVAKPRTSTSVGERLHVTERQYAQAEILQRIVQREDQEGIGARETARGLPIVRWLISLVLVLAVLLPPITGIPNFETPERVSRDLGPLLEVVNSVESGQPALVVFDFEPGYSAELEAVASTMLHNLMARGVHIVTLSTRPTGPPLALKLIDEVGEPHQIENGTDYIHLGYLSGGPTAVQLFSIAPKEAILKGFMLPDDIELQSGWEAPVLRGVERLSDFGMVAVITAGTDNARTWAEQAHPWLGDTPMVMVLSAGAEPMVRPYFESLEPQVDGILTGLPAALAYEQLNERPGQAQARWNAFGSGVLAVELILAVGLVYGLVEWVIERRREPEQE